MSCRSGRSGSGWAALRSAPPASAAPSLTVLGVDASFSEIGSVVGPGSVAERKRLVDEVMSAATAEEQFFLVRLLSGELRQGALDGVMTEAVARASEVPVAQVRRAVMLRGSLPAVAEAALDGGADALADFGLLVGQPLKPMLASSAPSVEDALGKIGAGTPAAVEWKLDGIRVQAHVSGGNVRLFTRTLDDITGRLPEVVAALAALPLRTAVFDGELIALRPDGRPYAFQDTASRAASEGDPAVPLSAFLFDVLHLDGADLIDLPDAERRAALAGAVPAEMLMPRLVTADARGGGRVLPRRGRPRARGRGGQVAGHALRGRAARGGLDQGQAAAHARPGGARGRVGARPAEGVAVQPAPGGARSGDAAAG